MDRIEGCVAVKLEIRKRRRQISYPADTILAGVGVCAWRKFGNVI